MIGKERDINMIHFVCHVVPIFLNHALHASFFDIWIRLVISQTEIEAITLNILILIVGLK